MSTTKRGTNGLRPLGRRQIGTIGTAVRVVLGSLLVLFGLVGGQVIAIHGQVRINFQLTAFILGVIVFPALLLGLQRLRVRFAPAEIQATGPVATLINILIFLALASTPLYAPQLSFLGYAAFIFYGASMLVAAVRGYSGCEVLAISNWILTRDDQVGCLVLSPIDSAERQFTEGQVR